MGEMHPTRVDPPKTPVLLPKDIMIPTEGMIVSNRFKKCTHPVEFENPSKI
jgi:hypothetical protein